MKSCYENYFGNNNHFGSGSEEPIWNVRIKSFSRCMVNIVLECYHENHLDMQLKSLKNAIVKSLFENARVKIIAMQLWNHSGKLPLESFWNARKISVEIMWDCSVKSSWECRYVMMF